MAKTEVYSWRVHPDLKRRLEDAAREERRSLAEVLDAATEEWLEHRGAEGTVDERQAALRTAATRFIGTIRSGRPDRAENARLEIRSRLQSRREQRN